MCGGVERVCGGVECVVVKRERVCGGVRERECVCGVESVWWCRERVWWCRECVCGVERVCVVV